MSRMRQNNANSENADSPITGSFTSDIVILSAWLNGQESIFCKPVHRDRNDIGLSTVTHLSTILTIGNRNAPRAQNVHAVIGFLKEKEVQCLVFSENIGFSKKGQGQGPTVECPHQIYIANSEHGQALLNGWDR